MEWNGQIPKRRYAIFSNTITGEYMIVVTEKDIERADQWGGFVKWIGKIREAETRKIKG